MLTLITIFHLILAAVLIVFVLLQDPKGGGAFGMGGGSTQSIFGASGANQFLVSATKYVAILFTGTCILLSYMTLQKESSVTDLMDPGTSLEATAPATPAAPAADGQAPAPDTSESTPKDSQ